MKEKLQSYLKPHGKGQKPLRRLLEVVPGQTCSTGRRLGAPLCTNGAELQRLQGGFCILGVKNQVKSVQNL